MTRNSIVACIAVTAFCVSVAPAGAVQLGSTPAGNIVTNGVVDAVARSATTIYLGGSFTEVGPRSGPAAALATSDGQATSVPQVSGGPDEVDSVVPDGHGGWYLGGAFTHVGTAARANIAHVLADGTIDPAFAPALNGKVSSLALSSDGSHLYAAGSFTLVGTANARFLTALDPATGAPITAFAPAPSGTVSKLVLAEGHLYASGPFKTMDGMALPRLAAVDPTTGAVVPGFSPAPSGPVNALLSDGTHLYVGGSFSAIGGTNQGTIAELDPSSGQAISAFAANANGSVYALALGGGKLYAGGAFSNNSNEFSVAALDPTTGAASSAFAPPIGTGVFSLAVSGDGQTVYIGGDFTASTATEANLVAASATDGSILAGFAPAVDGTVLSLTLAPDSSTLYAGGGFTSVGAHAAIGLAALNASDLSLDTTFNPGLHGAVGALALSPTDNRLYVGGGSDGVLGYNANLIAVDQGTGAAIPAFAPAEQPAVNALLLSGTTLYVGDAGDADVNGQGALLALSTVDGSAIAGFAPTVPDPVKALALGAGHLYAGGGSPLAEGSAELDGYLEAVDPLTGAADAGFTPKPDKPVNALALSADGTQLYAGGVFGMIGGLARAGVAALDPQSGAASAAFNAGTTPAVFALLPVTGGLFVGGTFRQVAGKDIERLAEIDPATGAPLPFAPQPGDAVNALAASTDGSVLDVGGLFRGFDSVSQSGFTQFSAGAPVTLTDVGSTGGTGGTGPTGASGSGLPRPTLTVLRGPQVHRTKHGTVTLDSGEAVACPVGSPACTVTADVQITAVVKRKPTTVVLARSTPSVQPGARGEISFTLTRAAARRLAKAHFLEVTVALTATAGTATPFTSSRQLLVQSPPTAKPRKHKHKPHTPAKQHRPTKR